MSQSEESQVAPKRLIFDEQMDKDCSDKSEWSSDSDGARTIGDEWQAMAERKMDEWLDEYAKNLFDLQVRKWLLEERKRQAKK